MKHISTVLREQSDLGEHLQLSEVVNQNMEVHEYRLLSTAWGDAAVVTIKLDGKDESFLTWSRVLIDQLGTIEVFLPLLGRIIAVKNYFTFVAPHTQSQGEDVPF